MPLQTDYSRYVRLEMNYDFMPTLCSTIIVNTELERFGCIIDPNSSASIAIGLIKSYHIHFAYRK